MGYGFFENVSAAVTQPTPSTITFINRPDMAIAVCALDRSLEPASTETKNALAHLGLNTPTSNLTSPQSMTNRLNTLTDRCKEIALETASDPFSDPALWLIKTVSSTCGFYFNFATKESNKTLPNKTNGSHDADIIIHKYPHQTLYVVPVQHGNYFEFLNQRHSHPTNFALDKRCEEHCQQQATRAEEETPQIIRAMETTRTQLLSELSALEIDTLYQESIRKPVPYDYPSITYTGSLEARATQVAQVSIYHDRLEKSLMTDASNSPKC